MKKARRKFLKQSLALSGVGIFALNLEASSKDFANSIKWDETWDVLVVGSGFAGSAATAQCVDLGVKVKMVEKMPVFGGNSAINGGAFAIVGSPQQKERKIDDSYDLYVKDILKAGRGLNQTDLVEVIAKSGFSAYEFAIEKGVIFRDQLGHFGGHSVPRTIWPTINSGGKITIPLQTYSQKNGAVLQTRVILDDFIKDDNGRVIGVKVRENYEFNFNPKISESENKSGITKFYRIKGGVVMATGGFSYDINFRQKIDPTLTSDIDCTNHYGATAYSLELMDRNNAALVDVDQIQLGPWGSPDELGFGIAPVFAIPAFSYGVMVDARNGKRFVNELGDRKERADAIIKVHKNKDGSLTHPIVICDKIGAMGTTKKNVHRALEKKVVYKFNSIKELAQFYNIPYDGLKKTIDTYNEDVKKGKDSAFNKPLFKFQNKFIPDISRPPFYAFRAIPKVHHTMGGVKIDTFARVIDKENKVIKGLFAAGEAVGGPHGASRLGSCAVPDCLVFGRIAAKNAVLLLKERV